MASTRQAFLSNGPTSRTVSHSKAQATTRAILRTHEAEINAVASVVALLVEKSGFTDEDMGKVVAYNNTITGVKRDMAGKPMTLANVSTNILGGLMGGISRISMRDGELIEGPRHADIVDTMKEIVSGDKKLGTSVLPAIVRSKKALPSPDFTPEEVAIMRRIRDESSRAGQSAESRITGSAAPDPSKFSLPNATFSIAQTHGQSVKHNAASQSPEAMHQGRIEAQADQQHAQRAATRRNLT